MRIVDTELIERYKASAVLYVNAKRGMNSLHLTGDLAFANPTANPEDITRAIHEAVQEGKLVRIEYTIPDLGSTIFAFYLPTGSKTL